MNSSALGSVIAATASKQPRSSRSLLASLLALASLSAILLTPSPAPAGVPAPKLSWHACAHPEQKGFQCATARVPLDHTHPRGRTINLAVIRHRATDPAHRIGTLFFNPGGPGGPGTFALPGIYDLFPPALRARFDLVSWDPRGVGASTAVKCFASPKAEQRFLEGVGLLGDTFPVGKAQKKRWIRRWRAFGQRCERTNGDLLRHVSTADTARDLNLLRQAVGDRRLSYWGVSYGTFLGATYANLFPSRVRALVLDSNVNPRALVRQRLKATAGLFLSTFLRQHTDQGTAKTMDAFLRLCGRTDTAHCAFSAGSAAGTRDKYEALLQRLRTDPASVHISYADLVSQIVRALGGVGDWPQAAECLQRLWTKGRFCPWPPGPALAEQVLAILCSDSPNPRPSAFWALDVFANRRSGGFGRHWSWSSEPCASWPATATDRYAGPWDRRTANPVLVIGTTHDPNTPYRGATAMARQLARARLLTVDGYGHISLQNPSACANGYATRYLIAKALPPQGARCKQDQQPFTG